MENNSTLFYTTAQVTEMVELSDQNVRKYVRLLEDRGYEVAKDEHNRRLFSGEDISVLRELIKLSKQPGYTLETAADQLASNANGGTVPTVRMTAVDSSNEFTQLLTSVVDKMQEMQNDQNELKEKMEQLLSKLDETSMALENSAHIEDVNESEKSADEESDKLEVDEDSESDVEVTEAAKSDEETLEADKSDEETLDEAVKEETVIEDKEQHVPSVEKFEAEKRENESSIDMSTYQEKTPVETTEAVEEIEEKGAFSKFLDFLRGK